MGTLQSLLDKYTAGLLPTAAVAPPATGPDHDMHVVISGSTGSLGSHLLHHLIVAPGVTKIYCLNRAKDGYAKQTESNSQRGLRDQWNPDKVKFIHIDVSQPRFGLDVDTYTIISDDVTHFIRKCSHRTVSDLPPLAEGRFDMLIKRGSIMLTDCYIRSDVAG